MLRFGKAKGGNDDYQLANCTFKPQTNVKKSEIRRPASAAATQVNTSQISYTRSVLGKQFFNMGGSLMDKILRDKGKNHDLEDGEPILNSTTNMINNALQSSGVIASAISINPDNAESMSRPQSRPESFVGTNSAF